jgi:hypothetical protein
VRKQIGGLEEWVAIQLVTSTWLRKGGDHQLRKPSDKNEDKRLVDCFGGTSQWIIPLISK